jgi:hypothetical protein
VDQLDDDLAFEWTAEHTGRRRGEYGDQLSGTEGIKDFVSKVYYTSYLQVLIIVHT